MSVINNIAKNTFVLFISQIIISVFGFFSSILAAKYMGVDGFGVLSLAIAIGAIFGVFSDLGLSTLNTREVARNKRLANTYLSNASVIKLFLAILTFLLLFIFLNLVDYPDIVRIVSYIIILSTIINSFSGLIFSTFQAYEKMEYQALGGILSSALLFIGFLLVIFKGQGVLAFAFVYLIASTITLIYASTILILKFFKFKTEFDLKFSKKMIKEALPLSIALIFAVINFRIDAIILSLLKGSVAVGYYSAPYRLMEFLTYIPIVFTSAIYPVLSRFHLSSSFSMKLSYELSFKYLLILSLPIAFQTTILSKNIILLVYSTNFTQSILVLQILIWTIPFIFLTYLLGTVITSINKQNLLYRVMAVSMSLNIILNLLLIPKFSYLGSSLVTVITEFVVFILYFHYVSKFVSKIKIHRIILKPLFGIFFMSLTILYLKLNLLILIPVATILYFIILIILKTFSKEEYLMFKKILSMIRL